MRIIEFIREGTVLLAPLYGEREAKAIALRLLQEVAGLNRYIHLTEPQASIREKTSGIEVEQRLQEGLQELVTGRPLQYVLGYAWFLEHKFRVCEGVLIPRPETEELVRHILKDYSSVRQESPVFSPEPLAVLDLCTGSGCIAWSLAAGLREKGRVYGCDVSEAALSLANGQEIFLSGKEDAPTWQSPCFFYCDVLRDDAAEVIAGDAGVEKFDLMVSNPPYVCESERALMHKNVLDFEPELALFVPDTNPLLFYRKIAALAARLLKPGGKLYFEMNERFGEQVIECMEIEGFSACRILKDIHEKERFAEGVLLDF